jgi:uncharacterized protein (TIGR02996 family)
MTEYDAFLQVIIESPDDDSTRLVFADWLEEHGDAERAKLIRLQCSLNSLPPASPELVPLEERVNLLLQARRNDYLTPLTRIGLQFDRETQHQETLDECVIAHLTATFRRGFVEDITIGGRESLETFLKHAEVLFRLTPLQHLEVSEVRGWSMSYDQGYPVGCYSPMIDSPRAEDLRALIRFPDLARLRTLRLRFDLGTEEAGVLANAPYLTDQTRLLLYPSQHWEDSWSGRPYYYETSPSGELVATAVEYRPTEEIERILRARFGDSVHWCR